MEKEKKWYAFYTNSRAEKKVRDRLLEKEIEVFLPLITKVKQWSDRKKKVSVPLINSYVFANIFEEEIKKVLQTPGCVGVLKYLGKPAVVLDEEIHNLEILVKGSAKKLDLVSELGIEKGKFVEVQRGPFQGLVGEFIEARNKYRLLIRFKSIGQNVLVDIPASAIKPLG